MNITELKEKYIHLLDDLDLDKSLISKIKQFVQTYNGTNFSDFKTALDTILETLIDLQEKEIKSKAFDNITSELEFFLKETGDLAQKAGYLKSLKRLPTQGVF